MIGQLLSGMLLLLQTAAPLAPSELPPAPKGFHWERAAAIKGAFLTPDGWFFKTEEHAKTLAYFVTREDLGAVREFRVGLTVNVTPHLEDGDAVQLAHRFIAAFPQGKKLLRAWDASTGPFVGGGCLVEDETTIMHTLMLANPKTNTLYLFIFEAPKAEWPEAWRKGNEIMELLALDDEI